MVRHRFRKTEGHAQKKTAGTDLTGIRHTPVINQVPGAGGPQGPDSGQNMGSLRLRDSAYGGQSHPPDTQKDRTGSIQTTVPAFGLRGRLQVCRLEQTGYSYIRKYQIFNV